MCFYMGYTEWSLQKACKLTCKQLNETDLTYIRKIPGTHLVPSLLSVDGD